MTVYADVLIILNLFVNYFLLLGCKILLRREVKRARLLLGACVGAVYSLIIFALAVGSVLSVLLKLLVSVLITLCAFGYGGLKSFLSACGSLFGMSFVFGGLMFALWIFVSPNGMVYKNGAVYFNISLLFVCFATVICYIAAIGLSKILRRGAR